jgi:hypothetical protein
MGQSQRSPINTWLQPGEPATQKACNCFNSFELPAFTHALPESLVREGLLEKDRLDRLSALRGRSTGWDALRSRQNNYVRVVNRART